MNKKDYKRTKFILKIIAVLACAELLIDIYGCYVGSVLFWGTGLVYVLQHIWLVEAPALLLWIFTIWASLTNNFYIFLIFPIWDLFYLPGNIKSVITYWHIHADFYLAPKLFAWLGVLLFCVVIIGLVTMLCEYYKIRKYSTT